METRYNRFLAAVGELSPARLEQVVSKDHPGEVALLAFADAEQTHVIAEAILVKTPDGHRCEMAMSVADAWQGKGVGTLLLRHLECQARTLDARFLFGDVLRTNTAMKSLARKEGFSVLTPFTDPRLVEVGKDL
jgi:acetyltransferase